MLKRTEIRAAVLGVALLGTAAAWYLISPLFTAPMLRAVFPTVGFMPTRTPSSPTETPLPTFTPSATANVAQLLSGENVSAQLVSQGEFYAVVHSGQGRAELYLLPDGRFGLKLTDFEVERGPELHVVLVFQVAVDKTEGKSLENSLDLGLLKDFAGDQVYELPLGIDLTLYHSVVIWSAPNQTPFIAASLVTPN